MKDFQPNIMDKLILFDYNPKIIEKIAKEYNRSEKSLNEDIENLQKWMTTQPHLPEILETKIIQNLLFLHKCSIERTKISLDLYFTIRQEFDEMSKTCNPNLPKMKKIMDIVHFVPLPKLTKEMYRVFICRIKNPKLFEDIEFIHMCGQVRNIFEIRLKEDVTWGDILIYDMKGITAKFITKISPSFLAKNLEIYKKIFSMPLKGFYFLNAPPFIDYFLSLFKMYLKPKLFSRIYVSQNTSILHEDFPQEIIPIDYGGQEQSIDELNEIVKLKLQEYKDFFNHLNELKVNEALRPNKPKNDELYGFYGNFRKLELD